MKVITHEKIKDLNIDPKLWFDWVDEMLMNKSNVILPKKTSIVPEDDVFFNVMPCMSTDLGFAGVKVITRRLERVPALDSMITLYDYKTLLPLAIMDGSWITTARTGAVAAHAISVLANKDFKEVGVQGVGNTGRAAVKVLLAKNEDRNMKLKVFKYKDQHLQLEQMIRGESGTDNPNVEIEFVDTHEQVISGSDVVISAVTYHAENFCDDACYKEGVTVIPIHLRGFMNCDLFFDKVYGDDRAHVEKFKYFDQWKSFAEVAQVIRGEAEGRTDSAQRIIAYNVGLSMHDINFANHVYQYIKEKGIQCDEVSLLPPTEKTWFAK